MSRALHLSRLGLLVSVALLGSPAFARAETIVDPALRFRVLSTEHFFIQPGTKDAEIMKPLLM